MKRETLDRLLADADRHVETVLITDLESGEQSVVRPIVDEPDAPRYLLEAARDALERDECVTVEHDGRRLFLQPSPNPLRLIIVGAVHIAQPLAAMAAAAAWDVVIVDPREAWATAARFPGVRLVSEWPDTALTSLAPDRRTAVVTLTHDPKLDDPALTVALRSNAFYVGALGSRKTHEARLKRLSETGFDEGELSRIHAPVGLAIGARTPAEVAVSILAEMTQTLRGDD